MTTVIPGPISLAATELEAALRTVKAVGVHRDPGAILEPLPAAVLGPPALTWAGQAGSGPESARFLVYVVVDPDERAVERLWELVAQVADAIDENSGAVVIRADPAVFVSGGRDLPCYELQVEASLT